MVLTIAMKEKEQNQSQRLPPGKYAALTLRRFMCELSLPKKRRKRKGLPPEFAHRSYAIAASFGLTQSVGSIFVYHRRQNLSISVGRYGRGPGESPVDTMRALAAAPPAGGPLMFQLSLWPIAVVGDAFRGSPWASAWVWILVWSNILDSWETGNEENHLPLHG